MLSVATIRYALAWQRPDILKKHGKKYTVRTSFKLRYYRPRTSTWRYDL